MCVARAQIKGLDHDAVSAAKANGSVMLSSGIEVQAEHLVFKLNVKCDPARCVQQRAAFVFRSAVYVCVCVCVCV